MWEHCSVEIYDQGFCYTSFEPIEALRKPETDTSIIFLTSTSRYCGPVTDPWFDAQECNTDWLGSGWTICRPASPVKALACAESKEICVGQPPHRRCTKIRSDGYPFSNITTAGLPNITDILNLTPRQAAIATRMQDASYRSIFADIIQDTGATNMLAFRTGDASQCAPALPDNQWSKFTFLAFRRLSQALICKAFAYEASHSAHYLSTTF